MSDTDRPQLRPTQIASGKHFGIVLRAARVAAGKRVEDVAAALGVSKATISYRESGDRAVSVTQAVDQLAACGYVLMVQADPHTHARAGTVPEGTQVECWRCGEPATMRGDRWRHAAPGLDADHDAAVID